MVLTLRDIVEKEIGAKVRAVVNPILTSVGTTALVVLANNPNRVQWLITNLDTDVLYLGFSNDVSSTKAFARLAQGDSARGYYKEDGDVVGWAVWGVSAASSSALYSVEHLLH